jgi:hypothetical protein
MQTDRTSRSNSSASSPKPLPSAQRGRSQLLTANIKTVADAKIGDTIAKPDGRQRRRSPAPELKPMSSPALSGAGRNGELRDAPRSPADASPFLSRRRRRRSDSASAADSACCTWRSCRSASSESSIGPDRRRRRALSRDDDRRRDPGSTVRPSCPRPAASRDRGTDHHRDDPHAVRARGRAARAHQGAASGRFSVRLEGSRAITYELPFNEVVLDSMTGSDDPARLRVARHHVTGY